jgi:acyl carrier protein
MNVKNEILSILDEVMVLKGRSSTFTEELPLFTSLPEMDSMTVVAVISQLEDRFGIEVDDDDISGETFYNLGSLVSFVSGKTGDMRQAA